MSVLATVRRRPLLWYFGLAWAVTWALLLPFALDSRGVVRLGLPPVWHALGPLGPFLAALFVARTLGGSALRDWSAGFRRWRVGSGWWLLGVASPFALFFAAALLVRAFGAGWPEFSRLASPEYANARWLADLLFIGTFAYGLGEEPGWRGFALPRLEERHGPLVATLILTPLWAVWHWPAFLYRPSYQGGAPVVVGFVFGLLAGAIVLTWLWDGTRGSLPIVILWHALINIVLQIAAVVSWPVLALMNLMLAAGAVAIAVWWVRRPERPPTRGARATAGPGSSSGSPANREGVGDSWPNSKTD